MAVKANVRATATGAAIAGDARLHGLHYVSTAVAGRITIKDGGGSGTTMVDVDTPAAAGSGSVSFGGGGLLFATDVHVSAISNVTAITLVYEAL